MPKNFDASLATANFILPPFAIITAAPCWEARARNLAVRILGELRARCRFSLIGYVLMPEHIHLLLSELGGIPPAKIVQIFKQCLSRRLRAKRGVSPRLLALRFPDKEDGLRRFLAAPLL